MWNDSRVQNLLRARGLDYETLSHFDSHSALESAAASCVPGWAVAKSVVVRDGSGRYLLAVVPATCLLDLVALARGSGHSAVTLATEEEVARLFPDCERGAIPPVGRLYGMPTFLDLCLCELPEIFFTAGSRQELVAMRVADFVLATGPMVGQFCRHADARHHGH